MTAKARATILPRLLVCCAPLPVRPTFTLENLSLLFNVAAIAARISEQLNRKPSRDIDDAASAQLASASLKATATVSAANINGEIYVSDGDYIKDIEVNDQRNRYIVTKASTQKMVMPFGQGICQLSHL